MRWFAICALALTVGMGASSPVVAQQTATTTEAKPIASLGWLVGGVWTADASKLGPGTERIETRYQWSDNGSYVRFTTHFVTDKGAIKTYDGNLFWDPGKKTLAMWYMDAQNAITEGPMTIAGSDWQMTFHGDDFEGKQADFRVDIAVKSKDLYHWTLNEKVGDAWKKLIELDYVRKTEG
ncbi:MAG TPA: hypothetical protein VIX90_06835 [Edaphobacter sp.]